MHQLLRSDSDLCGYTGVGACADDVLDGLDAGVPPDELHAVCGGGVSDLTFTALTDTRFYGLNYNIPSLCVGASGAAMHGFNEYVDLASLRKSTKATALFIAEWCGVEAI
jgi:hypothetical protein